MLADVSYSGALLTDTTIRPNVGNRVRVLLCLQDEPESLLLEGEVIRQTEDGFAIEYEKPHTNLQLLIDDAAAVVAAIKN